MAKHVVDETHLINQLSRLDVNKATDLLNKAMVKRRNESPSIPDKTLKVLRKEYQELCEFIYEANFTISGNLKIKFYLDDFCEDCYPYLSEEITVTFPKKGRRTSLQKYLEEAFQDTLENEECIDEQTPFDVALAKNRKRLKKLHQKIAKLTEEFDLDYYEIIDQVAG
jgi:hypothetical protein